MKNKDELDERKAVKPEESKQNLGLDADQSSEEPSLMTRLDDDNDRISGNPDGEHDVDEGDTNVVYSPLDDK